MPAKRKTTAETQDALRRLTAGASGMELTPGFTIGGRHGQHVNHEPRVWVFRRRVRIPGTALMQDTDAAALWDTLPRRERQRSRLFACCAECPVRFTKKGAIADAYRHAQVRRHDPPNEKERLAARLRNEAPPPELDPRTDFERMVVEVWPELTPRQRRTLYAEMRPSRHYPREWTLEGASSPQAYDSRVRSAYRGLARALGRRFCPGEYDLPTAGRTGFDYARFFDEWNLS